MVLKIDKREDDDDFLHDVKRVAEERGVDVTYDTLETGDYVYRDAAIEYKGINDAVGSVLDDRIYQQAERLAEEFEWAAIVINGKVSELDTHHTNMGYEQAYGQIKKAIPELLYTVDVPVLWLERSNLTADIAIRALLNAGELDKDHTKVLTESATTSDPRLNALMGIPNVGRDKAETIMEEFGSLRGVARAGIDELRDVTGDTTAKKIWNTFATPYDEAGMDPKHDGLVWPFFDAKQIKSPLVPIYRATNELSQVPDPYDSFREFVEGEFDLSDLKEDRVTEAYERAECPPHPISFNEQ